MRKSAEIKDFFRKFIKRECSPEEVQQILNYIKTSEDLSEVPTVAEVYDMLEEYPNMTDVQADILFNNILEMATPSKKKSHFWKYATVAATVVLVMVSGYFFRTKMLKTPSDITPVMVNNNIQIGTDKAILTLENGVEIPLEKEQRYVADHVTSNGEALIYNRQKNTTSEIAYNYLTIARGGQFQLKLADGTIVWLNSETKLKYPIAFIEGQTRQVELLYGEAYFDVSPSSNHQGSKFTVKTGMQDVEVLGTEFNIKANREDPNIYTTLVEGQVVINNNGKSQSLIPNQQAILNLDNNTLAINTVDVYNEISWKNGLFSFKGKSLIEITAVLSRWYDVEFEFDNDTMRNVKFNGVLQKHQRIEDILTIIKETKFINAYEIADKKIIIK